VRMKANASLCFVLTGFSLWFLRKRRDGPFAWVATVAAKTSACVAGLMGLFSLVEYISRWDFGIDQFLFLSPPGLEVDGPGPGLMSPITAGAFLLLGLALLGIDWQTRRGGWPAQILSLSAGACATFGILTFAFDPHIYGAHLSLALPTSVTLALFSLGLVCARTERGLGALLCRQSLGGSLARRLLPAAFIPVLVGGIRWQISATGLYSEWSIVVLSSFITMSLLAGLIASAAGAVDRSDIRRREAEQVRERLAAIVDSSGDAILSMTLEGTITDWNSGAERLFGYSSSEAMGKPLRILLPPDRENEESDILARIRQGESVDHFETVRVRKDGKNIDVSTAISPIKDSSGAVVGASKIARDITERKRSQEALRQSDARRKFALETAQLGDWELDLTTLQATRSFLHDEIFGYQSPLAEWTFDIFLGHVHPDDRERVRGNFQQCLSQGTRWDFECRIVCLHGNIRWIWACGDHYREPSGNATHMFGIVQDITERKQSEEALREQAQVLNLAQVLVRDMQGRIVLWNRGVENLYGFSKQEAVGRVSHELLQTEFPEPLAQIEEKLLRFGSWEGELVHLKRDHTRIVVFSLWVLHRDESGKPMRILEANTDITARKQAEQCLAEQAEELSRQTEELQRSQQSLETQTLMLQSVLDSISEGLVAADETGKFLLWNPAATRIVGMGAENVPPGEWNRHYGVFLPDTVTPFPPEQNPLLRAIRGEVCVAEMYLHNQELESGVWVETSASPLKNRDGVVHGGVIAIRDISQRRLDEQKIRQLNEELEERVVQRTAQLEAVNYELEAFTYSVSHDLRAPLRHIGGFSKILSEDFGPGMPPEAQSHLQRIEDGAHRMGLLVDELLNLARVGRHALQLQAIPLKPIVEEVVCLLQPEINGRAVTWKIADLATAQCDPILIKQVFQNLIANALKFTRTREHAIIEISQSQENGETVIAVSDNGVGFSMKYKDKLFGVFQRLHRAEDFEGTGIGLATAQRIVRKHGGRIWADAELDKGATFYFTLAAASPILAQANPAQASLAQADEVTNTMGAAGAHL
jgi:PAS domain S-box-containing protein